VAAGAAALFVWALGDAPLAHEHEHTHQNLARAAFRLLNVQFTTLGGLTPREIEDELAQGVIDEDECLAIDEFGHDWDRFPNWNSHFYEAKLRTRLSGPIAGDPFGSDCRDGIQIQGEHTSAADRARSLYQLALDDYRAGNYKAAFRVLGRVLHLVQDMTSPAHVHDDPHAEVISGCGGDADDFERWGFCQGLAEKEENESDLRKRRHTRICEYFYDPGATHHPDKPVIDFPGCEAPPAAECLADFDGDGTSESYGVPPPGFTCRLWSALKILYDAKPQVSWPNSVGENVGYKFVHKLSNVTYDFTTFTVHLQDISPGDDPLPEPSELSVMLRGSTPDDCAPGANNELGLCEATNARGWRIRGDWQDIGHTEAQEGKREGTLPDAKEEWWLMPTFYSKRVETTVFGGTDVFIDAFAYIENVGGEGPDGKGPVDSFVPLRYGCTEGETRANGRLCSEKGVGVRSKAMYQQLYGTVQNRVDPFPDIAEAHKGKTMLRIYGDALYASAVAYGAGLIRRFIDEVTVPPTAVAGGPYSGEACKPILFNASASSDANGHITAYAWDFTNDGTFDATSPAPLYPYAYPSVFNGLVRLRVTDNDGFTDEATTSVVVTPDVTAPVIARATATPSVLWPPNHQMQPVALAVSVADACGDASCRIVGVTSSEPGTGFRRKRREPDWIVSDALTLQLRAERSGAAGDRVYAVTISCVDGSGNVSEKTVNVIVPHDHGHPVVTLTSGRAAPAGKGKGGAMPAAKNKSTPAPAGKSKSTPAPAGKSKSAAASAAKSKGAPASTAKSIIRTAANRRAH